MDLEQSSRVQQHGSIPQLSRLPLPRASHEDLKHQRIGKRPSAIPLAFNAFASKPVKPKPLAETLNESVKTKYGWAQLSPSPQTSPTRDVYNQTSSLETTPPAHEADKPVYEDGNENAGITNKTPLPNADEKRRPRPSLSDRAIETLAQLSPSPHPARRRSSVISNDGAMRPPSRLASKMNTSRPTTPSIRRPASPTKRPFIPPGRSSPTKVSLPLPVVPSPNSLYEPPKAFVRDKFSRIAKPLRDPRRSVSTVMSESRLNETIEVVPVHRQTQTLKARPTVPARKPSLASIFKEPSKQASQDGNLAVSTLSSIPALSRPRSSRENALPLPLPKGAINEKSTPIQIHHNGDDQLVKPRETLKSSAALREAIATAKAARSTTDSPSKLDSGIGMYEVWPESSNRSESSSPRSQEAVIRAKCSAATTTGTLDLASLGLTDIPPEVMSMYEFDPNSKTSWAELVDLKKFCAAGNELEEIPEAVFPDWTQDGMVDGDDRPNHFGGLEHLDLHNNILKSLPIGLGRLEHLEVLNLKNNKLTFKSVAMISGMKSLRTLDLSGNSLVGDLPESFAHLDTLKTLRLANNAITSLPAEFWMLQNLSVLDIAGNNLSKFPTELLQKMSVSEVSLAHNHLTGVLMEKGESAITSLRTLDLCDNALEVLSDGQLLFPGLQTLSLDRNRLSSLQGISHCEKLVAVTASENQIKDIPAELYLLQSLKTLDLTSNSIAMMPAELSKMQSLTNLRIKQNPLRAKKYLNMDTGEIKLALEKLIPLREASDVEVEQPSLPDPLHSSSGLDQTSQTPRYRSAKGVLDLSSQSLVEILPNQIHFAEAIHTVNLSNNDLTKFPMELLSHPAVKYSIRFLNLSHNPLLHPTEYIDTELFLPSLESLCVVSTGLTSFDALTSNLRAPSLETLNISCHRLTGHVPWVRAWYPSVTTLLATDNWFNSIDVEAVRGLEVLDIRNNKIDFLPPKVGVLGAKAASSDLRSHKGKLRVFEVDGNPFRAPEVAVVEKGTEFVLEALRKMVPAQEMPEEWQQEA